MEETTPSGAFPSEVHCRLAEWLLGRRLVTAETLPHVLETLSTQSQEAAPTVLLTSLLDRGIVGADQPTLVLGEWEREAARPREDPPPVRIGRYTVLRKLGAGGMGTVYLACDPSLRRTVALKVMRGVSGREAIERFHREAQAGARLTHPGIVRVHDVGEADGDPYFTMEYVEGTSLDEWVRRRTAEAGTALLPLDEAVRLVQDVAEALDHAHTQGVVHRDLKPGNILMGPDGRPRITDFGLAKVGDTTTLTVSGVMMGTPLYMSPEQASGESARADARSDVFSIGVVFYELLTGRVPFRAENRDLLFQAIVSQDPPRIRSLRRGVPREVETICLKALEKSPDRRYARAGGLAEDLKRFRLGEPILARPPGVLRRVARALRRRRQWVGAIGVALLAAAGVLAWTQLRPGRVRLVVSADPEGIVGPLGPPDPVYVQLDDAPERRADGRVFEEVVSPGRHRLKVHADGFQTREEDVVAVGGSTVGAAWALRPITSSIDVEVDWMGATPGPADLRLGWVGGGPVPLTDSLKLAPGSYTLHAASRDCLATWLEPIRLHAGTASKVRVQMRPVARAVDGWSQETWVDGAITCVQACGQVILLATKKGCDLTAFSAEGMKLWTRDGFAGPVQPPILWVDLDGDGRQELLCRSSMGEDSGNVNALRLGPDGLPLDGWLWEDDPVCRLMPFRSPPVVGDVDGDGRPEVLIARARCNREPTQGDIVCVRGASGEEVWRFPSEGDFLSPCAPVLADADGDGEMEVIACSSQGEIVCLRARDRGVLWRRTSHACRLAPGSTVRAADAPAEEFRPALLELQPLVWRGAKAADAPTREQQGNTSLFSQCLVADLRGDGRWEVMWFSGPSNGYTFNAQGAMVARWSLPVAGEVRLARILDVGGTPEVLVSLDGGPVLRMPASFFLGQPSPWSRLNVPVAEADDSGVEGTWRLEDLDGRPEILTRARAGGIAAYSLEDRLLWEHEPTGTGAPMPLPSGVDLRGDGELDLLVGTQDGRVRRLVPSPRARWEVSIDDGTVLPLTLRDWNGDGVLDVGYRSEEGRVQVRSGLGGAVLTEHGANEEGTPTGDLRPASKARFTSADGRVCLLATGPRLPLRCVDSATRRELWSASLDQDPAAVPLVVTDARGAPIEVVLGLERRVVAFDPEDGHVRWRYDLPRGHLCKGMAVGDLECDGSMEVVVVTRCPGAMICLRASTKR